MDDPRRGSRNVGLARLINTNSFVLRGDMIYADNWKPGEFTTPRPLLEPGTSPDGGWSPGGYSTPGAGVWSSRGKSALPEESGTYIGKKRYPWI
jgi:hypothetical protein